MNRSVSFVALAFALSLACSSTKPAPAAPVEPAPAAASPVVTLEALENGDRACYLVVETERGETRSLEGAFDLCEGGGQDASPLIGQRITYATEKGNVLAAECEGDLDCGKYDEVDLVISVTAAP